ncbi:TIP41-like protein [Halichondria panicea]|uniref:TIP41-like protein n=1 Tax=Halichondria panicea TaxID=6063 RepID=UPI00312B8416
MARTPAASRNEFEAGPWRFLVVKNHILRSSCERGRENGCDSDNGDLCTVCRYGHELNLPSLPEMVFPESRLELEHECGCVLSFITLDALKLINSTEEPLKVAAAEDWVKTRGTGLQEVGVVVKPFDWTYTTDYKGTLSSKGTTNLEVTDTSDRIDFEQLKQQEQIFFYDEVILYEDELADNGTAVFSVKIRVMASGFFILSRFFLRVDGVLVRMNESRFYHQAGTDHILREYTSKEAKIADLKVHPSLLTDPNKLGSVLPTKELTIHKITIPKQTTSLTT